MLNFIFPPDPSGVPYYNSSHDDVEGKVTQGDLIKNFPTFPNNILNLDVYMQMPKGFYYSIIKDSNADLTVGN